MLVDGTSNYTFSGPGAIGTTADFAGNILQGLPHNYVHGNAPQTLTKNGTGTLTFANTGGNTFSGGIFTSGGTIAFNQANQLGDGNNGINFIGSAALRANADNMLVDNAVNIAAGQTATIDTQANTLTMGGVISGDSLNKTGTGVLVLTNSVNPNTANTYTGTTTVSQGTLLAKGANKLGASSAARTVDILGGAVLEVESTASAETLDQLLAGDGSFTKSGGQSLTLTNNANSYAGTTTINGGRLIAETVGTINGGNTAEATIAAGASLEMKLDGSGEDGTLNKHITGAGTLVKSGVGSTLTLTNSQNSYGGGTYIQNGTVKATNTGALGQSVATNVITVASVDSTLELALDSADGVLNQYVTGAGRLVKSGSRELGLNGANDFTGGTTLSGGGIRLGNGQALGTYSVPGGTAGLVSVVGNNTWVNLNAANAAFQNHFDVASGLTWTLGADQNAVIGGVNNSGTGGAITLNGSSTMNVNNNAAITFNNNQDSMGSNDIAMAAGSNVNFNGPGDVFINSGIRGQGTVSKAAGSTGLVQIAADSDFAGQTQIDGGTLRVTQNNRYGTGGPGTSFGVGAAGTIAGGGTVKADTISISGVISSDSAVLSAANNQVSTTSDERFGILTLDGEATLNSGFKMEYDAHTSSNPSQDLLVAQNGNLNVNEGTINLRNNGTLTGSYKIMDSDRPINLFENGGQIDNPNYNLTATINGNPRNTGQSVRGGYEFFLRENGINDQRGSELWLDVVHNSLNMTWLANPENNVWTGNASAANWISKQGTNGPDDYKDSHFNNGDYVSFVTAGSPQDIVIDGNVLVSGFDFNADSDYSFGGAGSIAGKISDPSIEGIYLLPNAGANQLIPDGKLQKKGQAS